MNDYERYDFWHREMESVVPSEKRSMKKLIESARRLDEKTSPEDRMTEDISGYAHSILTNSMFW
jgi:hypothetical protein